MGQHKSGSRSPMETGFRLPPELEESSFFVPFFLLQQNGVKDLVFGELRSCLPRHTLTMLPFVVKIVKFTHCEDPYELTGMLWNAKKIGVFTDSIGPGSRVKLKDDGRGQGRCTV